MFDGLNRHAAEETAGTLDFQVIGEVIGLRAVMVLGALGGLGSLLWLWRVDPGVAGGAVVRGVRW